MIYEFCTHAHSGTTTRAYDAYINLFAVTIVDDRKNGFTDVDNNVFVRPVPFTVHVILRPGASVSLWTKLFQDYVKLGSFSDNKTETRIKSSRFKSHKGRAKGRERKKKKVYDDRRGISFGEPTEYLNEIFSSIFYCPAAII